MCYTALWYFPVLIVAGGIITVIWDLFLHRKVTAYKARRAAKKQQAQSGQTRTDHATEEAANEPLELPERNGTKSGHVASSSSNDGGVQRRHAPQAPTITQAVPETNPDAVVDPDRTDVKSYAIPIPVGLTIIAVFFGECHASATSEFADLR